LIFIFEEKMSKLDEIYKKHGFIRVNGDELKVLILNAQEKMLLERLSYARKLVSFRGTSAVLHTILSLKIKNLHKELTSLRNEISKLKEGP